MKKFRILLEALVLGVVAATIFACAKENGNKVANICEKVTVSKNGDMSAYLKEFKAKMQSASKDDETLSIEDARWHLEAVLNYTYGDAGYLTSDIQCDTFYYELPIDGDEIPLNRLNEVFMVLSKDVEIAFTECNLPEKSVLAIQTTVEDKRKGGNVIVQAVLFTRGLPTLKTWFDSTDYWSDYYNDECHYGNGKCGPYAGQCYESGAPRELTKLANVRIPEYGCREGYRKYVTDIEVVWLNAIENSDFIWDDNSPCGYKIYYNSGDPTDPSHNPSHCIPPDDMNYYLSKFTEIVSHYTPNGKSPLCAMYMKDFFLGPFYADDLFWLVIQYGTIQCVPQMPNPDE